MWWALDLDDFNGMLCNQGPYPLISGVKNLLEDLDKGGPKPTPRPTPGPTPGPTGQCQDPRIAFENVLLEGLKARFFYFD